MDIVGTDVVPLPLAETSSARVTSNAAATHAFVPVVPERLDGDVEADAKHERSNKDAGDKDTCAKFELRFIAARALAPHTVPLCNRIVECSSELMQGPLVTSIPCKGPLVHTAIVSVGCRGRRA